MSSKSASQDMVDIEKGIKSEATRDHDDVLKQDVGRDVTASALSSARSSIIADTSTASFALPSIKIRKVSATIAPTVSGWDKSPTNSEAGNILSSMSPTSRTLSSGLSPPNSSAPIVATTQEPEERRKRQERLNEHDKALYDLVRAQKDSPEGLRALFVGEDALK
jgi:hypothetical protein